MIIEDSETQNMGSIPRPRTSQPNTYARASTHVKRPGDGSHPRGSGIGGSAGTSSPTPTSGEGDRRGEPSLRRSVSTSGEAAMLAARVSRRVIARALIDTRKHENAKTKHEY